VDEYQDSNLVQELITTCVSGWVNERKNIFMVGDVKQSIYRFRLARPELFMEKYKRFSLEDSEEQRIDLHRNFRSRPEVLESVNFIFRQIMGEDLGGVAYDEAAALYPAAVFPEGQSEEFVKTEVLLVETDSPELEDEQEEKTARELEALAIAHKIQDMAGREKVLDKETGEYRPLEYGDIVILLRTFTGWAETFSEVLSAQGIPSYTTSKTGYFSTTEVVTLLNYLRICDNPLQDIPLAGVLRSPIVGCTSQELAELRSAHPEGLLYECVCASQEEKLCRFVEQLEKIRAKTAYTPVHELIVYVLRETGYGNYARALPDGEQRSANLSMLVEKAMDYEKTSYRGLFNFVRYIEQLQKFEVDFGEVNLSGAGQGAVQIMTIHKSKGLEFPVVFAAGMGKHFNFQDVNAGLIVHPDLGVGMDAVLPQKRVVTASLYKQMLRRHLLQENLGEELRVLYVALTRAKEKLILTGTIGNMEKYMMFLSRFLEQDQELLPMGTRIRAKNYWAFILPALARHRCMQPLFGQYGILVNAENPLYASEAEFVVRKVTAAELTQKEVGQQVETEIRRELLTNWDSQQVYQEEIRTELERRFGFVYPYQKLREIPVKVSVSELKKRSYHDEYEKEEVQFAEPDVVPLIPEFVEKKEKIQYTGASRGTAYHRIMECLDYSRTESDEELRLQIQELLEQQKLSEAEADCIRIRDLQRFLQSSLGKRMKQATAEKMLFREQPFMISREARKLDPNWDCEERVLVQGIIDAYFMEDEDIVLVDYKTDKVRQGEEQKLVELYHVQLEDYACALERMTGKRVKETYIYSFTLGKPITVETEPENQ
jgi:ATP-dependent helicase/nuclease subunit A